MYRCTIDNAITYSSEDFVLFRESPFACWMERLTLDNPDHGIPFDLDNTQPCTSTKPQDELAATLRAEGRQVCLIGLHEVEADRRSATRRAMGQGVDFIINGQLALGSLAGPADMLMRTSGYSELGDFLYIPCTTQAGSPAHSIFRLCFLADLLQGLQGQLPPEMLIIRAGEDLVPVSTEEHIYHYRAVKQRFMYEMRSFTEHRMPDPAESSHFGRWSNCARTLLRQQFLREAQQVETGDSVNGETVAAGAGAAAELDGKASPDSQPSPGRQLPPVGDADPGSETCPEPGLRGVPVGAPSPSLRDPQIGIINRAPMATFSDSLITGPDFNR